MTTWTSLVFATFMVTATAVPIPDDSGYAHGGSGELVGHGPVISPAVPIRLGPVHNVGGYDSLEDSFEHERPFYGPDIIESVSGHVVHPTITTRLQLVSEPFPVKYQIEVPQIKYVPVPQTTKSVRTVKIPVKVVKNVRVPVVRTVKVPIRVPVSAGYGSHGGFDAGSGSSESYH